MSVVLLLVGLVLIIKCADTLIGSSANIARRYGISPFVIGITVIAFGTSAPELAVGIVSGVAKANELTLGNIIGSALSNIALIVGICAVIFPLTTKESVAKRELPMLLLVQLALSVMLLNGRLSRVEGILLLLGFALFILYIVHGAKKAMRNQLHAQDCTDSNGDAYENAPARETEGHLAKLWIYSLLSLIGLFVGGKLTVDGSTAIAQSLGLSQSLIGLTVVALATTMPELITSLVAILKKEPDIVLGNCIGSNIFNMLLVLGTSSVIHPITASGALWIDIAFMFALTLFVYALAQIRKKIQRTAGVLLVVSYAAYIAYKVSTAL